MDIQVTVFVCAFLPCQAHLFGALWRPWFCMRLFNVSSFLSGAERRGRSCEVPVSGGTYSRDVRSQEERKAGEREGSFCCCCAVIGSRERRAEAKAVSLVEIGLAARHAVEDEASRGMVEEVRGS